MKKVIFVYGPPGSGKGTVTGLFKDRLDALGVANHVLDMGGSLRQLAEKDRSVLSFLIQGIHATGELLPSAVPAYFWIRAFGKMNHRDEDFMLIFDGAVRTPVECILFAELAKALGVTVEIVELCLPDADCATRMQDRSRIDDNPIVIQKRLNVYRDKTRPTMLELIRSLEGAGVSFRHSQIDAAPVVEAVFQAVCAVLLDSSSSK